MMKLVDRVCVAIYFMGMVASGLVLGALVIFFSPVILIMWLITTIEERAEAYLARGKEKT